MVVVPASSPFPPLHDLRSASPGIAAGPGELPASVYACLHAHRRAWKRSWQRFRSAPRGPPRAPEARASEGSPGGLS
eukprot:5804756-Pyramimonas_sp.AAC.1